MAFAARGLFFEEILPFNHVASKLKTVTKADEDEIYMLCESDINR